MRQRRLTVNCRTLYGFARESLVVQKVQQILLHLILLPHPLFKSSSESAFPKSCTFCLKCPVSFCIQHTLIAADGIDPLSLSQDFRLAHCPVS